MAFLIKIDNEIIVYDNVLIIKSENHKSSMKTYILFPPLIEKEKGIWWI